MYALLFVLFFSTAVHAQEYILTQIENHHYRDYTRAELEARLGTDSALLSHYVCNGDKENDIFWPAIRQNPKGDSLTVKPLEEGGIVLTYKKGKFFKPNGKRVKHPSDTFVIEVASALKKIESFPEGAMLIRQLELSSFPLTIAKGMSAFSPFDNHGHAHFGIYQANALSIFNHGRMTSENVPFESIGAGGRIGWNPKNKDMPAHIALAHEMYHAFDSIRGLIDMRFVHGENYESAMMSEYRATYIENLARKAAGVKYRTHYGQDQSGPGLLGADGEPRKMPSPCLK